MAKETEVRTMIEGHLSSLIDTYRQNDGEQIREFDLALHDEGDHDGHNIQGGEGGDIEGHMGGDIEGHMGGDPGSRFYMFVHRFRHAVMRLNVWRGSDGSGTEDAYRDCLNDEAKIAPSAAELGAFDR
jgi:hypothetical protein